MIVLLYCFFVSFGWGREGGYSSEVPDLMNRVFVFGCSVPADVSSTAGGEDVGSWEGGKGSV